MAFCMIGVALLASPLRGASGLWVNRLNWATYTRSQTVYTQFDAACKDLFKLGAARPKSVESGTMRWDPQIKLLRVNAQRPSVSITLER